MRPCSSTIWDFENTQFQLGFLIGVIKNTQLNTPIVIVHFQKNPIVDEQGLSSIMVQNCVAAVHTHSTSHRVLSLFNSLSKYHSTGCLQCFTYREEAKCHITSN